MASLLVTSANANGGLLVHSEQAGGYDVSISVRPAKPEVGVVIFVVLVQAVAATNGDGEAHLLPIATDLRLRGKGPDGASVGPLQPSTVLAGLSHFDVRVPVERAGQWMFTFDVSGALGDVAAEVPIQIAPAGAGIDTWLIGGALTVTLLMIGAVVAVGMFRRRSNLSLNT